MEKVPVRLSRTYDRYNSGEVAGFKPQKAKKLVDLGWARYLDENPSGGTKAARAEEPTAEPETAAAEEQTPEAEAPAEAESASEEKPSGGTKRKRRRKTS